jgi:hypothetical protein
MCMKEYGYYLQYLHYIQFEGYGVPLSGRSHTFIYNDNISIIFIAHLITWVSSSVNFYILIFFSETTMSVGTNVCRKEQAVFDLN